jgi:glycine dehydrogenase subunit 2
MTLTGMPAVALSPKAGAHGELCGMLAIRAALERAAKARASACWCPSAHGTNPATAACSASPSTKSRRAPTAASISRRQGQAGPDVAGIMLTNPNTCGLFERDIMEIADAIHAAGALLLLRRRQLQRHRRQGAPGRSRRRCDAHQPAQDLLDAARRRRSGRGPDRALAALAPFAPVPFVIEVAAACAGGA